MAQYVISDIHGYLDRMFDVLRIANFDWDNDELYVLGDVIDRGPQSAEALYWGVEEAPSNVHFLLGNHEDMACRALTAVEDILSIDSYIYEDPWSWNGGYKTLDNCREMYGAKWCHKAANWIRNLPLYYTLRVNGCNILLVHAGIADGIRLGDDFITTGRDEMVEIPSIGEVWSQHLLWVRDRWFYDRKSYPYDYIIFGHTPTTYSWWWDLNWFDEKHPIAVQGQPGYIVRLSGYGDGHMRYCIDTGRHRMGLLRLDDMTEFYSDLE